jgi:hypothetical protein
MAVVGMKIVEPQNNAAYYGSGGSVVLRGDVNSLPGELDGVQLYFRWYDSFFEADKDRYSVNAAALTDPQSGYPIDLVLGSHAITLAAADVAGETDADLEAVQHGGMTGGGDGDNACVVHVLIANMMPPATPMSRAGSVLEAEAPVLWGQPIPETPDFKLNETYHAINRLLYRWEFQPSGGPAGRSTVNFIPADNEYVYFPPADPIPALIRYAGRLPDELDGNYTLRLHVEDAQGELGGHTGAAVAVTIVA